MNNLSRAGNVILISIIVVGALNILHRWPNKEREGAASGQTAEIWTDIGQNPAEKELWRITAYCPKSCCCQDYADGITASGHKIRKGDKFCAAPPEIPFGTMLNIPGYGTVPVLDRGGAIKGRRLDVFFDDANGISGHQRALNWGVQYLRIGE